MSWVSRTLKLALQAELLNMTYEDVWLYMVVFLNKPQGSHVCNSAVTWNTFYSCEAKTSCILFFHVHGNLYINTCQFLLFFLHKGILLKDEARQCKKKQNKCECLPEHDQKMTTVFNGMWIWAEEGKTGFTITIAPISNKDTALVMCWIGWVWGQLQWHK